jgi:hypothetical protein
MYGSKGNINRDPAEGLQKKKASSTPNLPNISAEKIKQHLLEGLKTVLLLPRFNFRVPLLKESKYLTEFH